MVAFIARKTNMERLAEAVFEAARTAVDEKCPCCGNKRPVEMRAFDVATLDREVLLFLKSCSCNALYGQMTYQESLKIVKNQMEPATGLGFSGDVTYYDFEVFFLDEAGQVQRDRRHGWFNIHTGLIVQTG